MDRLTPLEIQKAAFPRRLNGVDPDAVREFLALVAQQVEEDTRVRGELKAQLAKLTREIEEFRERTNALSQALVAAQRAADDTVARAEERAQQVVAEAQSLADRVLEEATRRAENIELITGQLRDRRRAARADLRRLADLLVGLASDDESSESRTTTPSTVALLRPRVREGKGER